MTEREKERLMRGAYRKAMQVVLDAEDSLLGLDVVRGEFLDAKVAQQSCKDVYQACVAVMNVWLKVNGANFKGRKNFDFCLEEAKKMGGLMWSNFLMVRESLYYDCYRNKYNGVKFTHQWIQLAKAEIIDRIKPQGAL
jgi:hypothetical protein